MSYRLGSNEIEFINVDAFHGPTEQMKNIADKISERFNLGGHVWYGNNDNKWIKFIFNDDVPFEQDEEFEDFVSSLIPE